MRMSPSEQTALLCDQRITALENDPTISELNACEHTLLLCRGTMKTNLTLLSSWKAYCLRVAHVRDFLTGDSTIASTPEEWDTYITKRRELDAMNGVMNKLNKKQG